MLGVASTFVTVEMNVAGTPSVVPRGTNAGAFDEELSSRLPAVAAGTKAAAAALILPPLCPLSPPELSRGCSV